MSDIKVETKWLIGKLEYNKRNYTESLDAVIDAWKAIDTVYQEEYRKYSEKIATRTLKDDDKQPCAPPKPIDRAKDYNFYIDFFKDDLETEKHLTEGEYRMYVKDQWSWMGSHLSSIGFYLDASQIAANSISASTVQTLHAAKAYYNKRI